MSDYEKAFEYINRIKKDIENSCYKTNVDPKKELIIQTILNSKIDYIPINQCKSCMNLFILDKHQLLYILSDKDWNYQFATMSGWGFNTPFLIIECESHIYNDCNYLELFLPKDELLNCGKDELAEFGYNEVFKK